MSQGIARRNVAARIAKSLDEIVMHPTSTWQALRAVDALRAVLYLCNDDAAPSDAMLADGILFLVAHQLGVNDSPAAAGSQPTTAGGSTLTDPLVVAVGVALAGTVWDPPLPTLPVGQWTDIVSLIAKCVREHDEGKRFIAEDARLERAADAASGGECA